MNRSRTAVGGHGRIGHWGIARRSRLIRYLAVGYTLLIAYASLYPFRTWRGPGSRCPQLRVRAVAALLHRSSTCSSTCWPTCRLGSCSRLPLLPCDGTAPAPRSPPRLAGTALSLALEVLQDFIPERVSSNLDLLNNGLGAMIGALLSVTIGARWVLSGKLYRLRQRVFLPGAAVDSASSCCCCGCSPSSTPRCGCSATAICAGCSHDSSNLEFSPETRIAGSRPA